MNSNAESKTLPEGWGEVSLEEACKVITSPVDRKTVAGELPVKLCNYTDVYYNNFIDSKIRFMTASAKPQEIGKFSIFENDVIITKDSETPDDIGVPAYVKETISNLLCGYHLTILRPKKQTLGKYVRYALTSPRVKHNFYRFANGITRFGLTAESYQKIKIPLPPLSEQKAIASLLETWDTAIEKTEALIAAKEKRFKWLLKTLISDQQDDRKWKITKLEDLCRIKKGEQLNKLQMTKTGKYLALNGGITPSGYTDKWNTPANTVTISEGGNSCGYINFNAQNFWAGGHCYTLTDLTDELNVWFLYYQLKEKEQSIMRLRVGSGLPNIQKGDIEKLPFALPSLSEQKQVSHALNTGQHEIYTLKQVASKYRMQKRGLMQKLMMGKWKCFYHFRTGKN